MAIEKDCAGDGYLEWGMSDNEQIRVTCIENQVWAGGPTVRVQKRAFTGRISPGPEFPAARAMDLIGAVSELVTGR